MELLFELFFLVVGAILIWWGYFHSEPNVTWAIVVGVICLLIGGIWLGFDYFSDAGS